MNPSLIFLLASGLIVLLAAVWTVAYRVGFGEGRLSIPLRLIDALAEHKIGCLHEQPDQVARELTKFLDVPERESRRLVARGLASVSPHPQGLRSA